ncbi:MAG: ATP-dependent DNA helicase RecG [Terriglobales bacterium]
MDLASAVRELPGVGPKWAPVLAQRGIETLEDLLYYLPFRYEDRSLVRPIAALQAGETATVCVTVTGVRWVRTRRGVTLLNLEAEDATGRLRCTWFHADFLRGRLQPGQLLALYGRVEASGGAAAEMRQPEFELLRQHAVPADQRPGAASLDSLKLGRIVPVYTAVGPLSSGRIRVLAAAALRCLPRELPETLPAAILAQMQLPARRPALEQVHFPSPGTALSLLQAARTPGHRRLIFEELFFLEYGIALKRRRALRQTAPLMRITPVIRERLKEMLPFHPTGDQKQALKEIAADLGAGRPMRRLLQGDVGSGKTLVGLQAAVIAIENGYQVALMAPTQILAAQHDRAARERLGRYRIALITAATARRRRAAGGRAPAPQLVVGTHALLAGGFQLDRPGLVIVDEQHRFGVMQRFDLMRKGGAPGHDAVHLLVMTATPNPRTLALTLYGDLDTSVLREMPPGRLPCITRVVPAGREAELYEFVRRQLARGRQAYFVYPLITETPPPPERWGQGPPAAASQANRLQRRTAESLPEGGPAEVKAAERMARVLRGVYREYTVGLLHGRLSDDKKAEVMAAFAAGRIQILVATTVIEVGLDIPNATVMVIEDAGRFGIAQLHQLRGRVGRPQPGGAGGGRAYCFLLPGAEPGELALRRLQEVAASNDGFALAEMDLRLRGPGEVFGARQSGVPELEVADPLRDQDLLAAARAEARHYAELTPPAEQRGLVRHIQARWQRKYGLIEVG